MDKQENRERAQDDSEYDVEYYEEEYGSEAPGS
jgi:hypothetical protein